MPATFEPIREEIREDGNLGAATAFSRGIATARICASAGSRVAITIEIPDSLGKDFVMNSLLTHPANARVAVAETPRAAKVPTAPLAAAAVRAEAIAQEEIRRLEREREAERVRFQLD